MYTYVFTYYVYAYVHKLYDDIFIVLPKHVICAYIRMYDTMDRKTNKVRI